MRPFIGTSDMLCFTKLKRNTPLGRRIYNQFELDFAIRESNINAIESLDLKRRENNWRVAMQVNYLWDEMRFRTQVTLRSEKDNILEYTGLSDEAAKIIEHLAGLVCNVRKNALLIDQLSREIAKIELLDLSGNNSFIERKNTCEYQLTEITQSFANAVSMFKRYEEKLILLDYGLINFTVNSKEAMLKKYFKLFETLQTTENLPSEDPIMTVSVVPKQGTSLKPVFQ